MLEAGCVAFRAGDDFLLVGFGLLLQARGQTLGFGQHLVGVSQTFVTQLVLVLTSLHRIVEGRQHLLGRLHSIDVDFGDAHAQRVAIQHFLNQLLGVHRDLSSPFVQHEIDLVAAHHFADRGFGRLLDDILRVALARSVVEQEGARVLDVVLHRQLDIDDVLVRGQHQRLFRNPRLGGIAVADFHAAHFGQVNDLHLFNRERRVPLQPRLCYPVEAAQTQHHALLAGVHHVETAGQPQRGQYTDHGDSAAFERRLGAGRRASAGAAALGAQQPRQLLI